jgi:hypothetical protein
MAYYVKKIGLTKWFKETILGIEPLVETVKVRARTTKGRFMGDDPSTPNINEAYTTVKKAKPKKKIKAKPKKKAKAKKK